MSGADDFTPKLGKIRSQGSKRGQRYLARVLRNVALAGGVRKAFKSSFKGSRIGRGGGVGRVLGARDRYGAYRMRRVVIKARFVRGKGAGKPIGRLHLAYIQREGVTRDGAPGVLYDATQDQADGNAFLARGQGDRHQFRFIVAPEDGATYDDLKGVTRRLMTQMEIDLGTKLDWVAVDHFNTGHPHTHIMVRGKSDRGEDLVIAPEYLSKGMRERASEIVSLDLGPRTDVEIETRLENEIGQERFTSLDWRLLRDVGPDGLVTAHRDGQSPFQHSLRGGRLQTLKRMGLAEEVSTGVWRLAADLEPTLRSAGLKGDIIKTIHREMTERGLARSAEEYAIYDPSAGRPVTGQVIARGTSDELKDHHYLIVDGSDGQSHYVDLGLGEATAPTPRGAIVEVTPKRAEVRAADRTVAEIAAANGGRYDVALHQKHDPGATREFIQTHVRRLEAMRRADGGLERTKDGTWLVGDDHLRRAEAYERRMVERAPVAVRALSLLALDDLVNADGATWLDRELTSGRTMSLQGRFGGEVQRALQQRRQWLITQGLAKQDGRRIMYAPHLLGTLQRRELTRVAQQLSRSLGKSYVEKTKGDQVEGIYRRPVQLVSGKFALIEEAGRAFALVPWRTTLERHVGKEVSGVVRAEGISWTIGRARGLAR